MPERRPPEPETHEDSDTPAKGWGAQPSLSPVDLAAVVWRERLLIGFVALLVLAAAVVGAFLQKTTYEAQSRVLVRMGQEYVFTPKVGTAGVGAAPRLEEMVNAELKLLQSPMVAKKAIEAVGLKALYPDIAARYPGAAGAERAMQEGVRALNRHLKLTAAAQTPIITLRFRHEDRVIAAKTVNALTTAYFAYRRDVLVDPAASAFAAQGADFQTRLAAANADLSTFLKEAGVGDYEAARKTLADIAAKVEADLFAARAEREAVAGQVASLRARVGEQAAQIELYSESDAARTLVQLQLERAQLAAKFEAEAPPLKEIDRRIAEIKAYLDGDLRAGMTRRGANPVRQELETQLYTLEAQLRAIAAREAALIAQRRETESRLLALQALEPRYRELTRARAVLEDNARAFTARAEEARAFEALAGQAADSVRLLEQAEAPARGSSLRFEILAAGLALGLVLGFTVGLVRGLLRRSFPTAQSAARSVGAPVLVLVPKEKAA